MTTTKTRTISSEEREAFAGAYVAAGLMGPGPRAELIARAVVIIQYGAELGVEPVSALRGIVLIDGKLALTAGLLTALIGRSGRYRYRVIEHSDQSCELHFLLGEQMLGVSAFSMDDARRAGVQMKSRKGVPTSWAKYPKNMLFARALSNGARWYCADLFHGSVYTPEELGTTGDGIVSSLLEDDAVQRYPEPSSPPPVEDEILGRLEEAHTDAIDVRGARNISAKLSSAITMRESGALTDEDALALIERARDALAGLIERQTEVAPDPAPVEPEPVEPTALDRYRGMLDELSAYETVRTACRSAIADIDAGGMSADVARVIVQECRLRSRETAGPAEREPGEEG